MKMSFKSAGVVVSKNTLVYFILTAEVLHTTLLSVQTSGVWARMLKDISFCKDRSKVHLTKNSKIKIKL